MTKTYQKALFVFRRDLRLEDNKGLLFALKQAETVIPAFIFTPEQIENNPYRSDHCLKFMIESLQDLDEQLKKKMASLYLFRGTPEAVVERCIVELHIDALVINRDYTPYSQRRDGQLETLCARYGISFYSFDDALLHAPEEALKKDGKPYTIFTPYFRHASKLPVAPPTPNQKDNYFRGSIAFAEGQELFSQLAPKLIANTLKGGRGEGLAILKTLSSFEDYSRLRNFPAENGGTHLSAYLKFTVCSVREVYAAICSSLGPDHDLIRSLYWRDFFSSIALYFPHVFGSPFRTRWEPVRWSDDRSAFDRWCQGMTGFPLVDAGMREMNETGFMHNRVRMVAASFLVKDLKIDWRWGEKYFAQTLVDYDPAVNNGNWQWVAGTGCDAQPYYRIFNPWSQQKKFDPDSSYIKKWIPELESSTYPCPMVDHAEATKRSI